ncbi:LysR family transcriptional regulator [Paraburkholderia sp. JPY432]|uniref:LysR family transcriptional regulator n=1 Tax=Paraburkholderia youngii TaxID=2782701 RepID=UPI00159627D1|nr:LysR family transcriptional regulator [Paraburkholderia youngii]NVH77636.1 LysR family transcriptional regulator [Paraburkholderia youngii]
MNTFQNMQILVRLIDTGSFTSAAASLDVSLGTASRAVSELEEHLRTRLLHRSTRRVSPTREGLAYAERCRRILADVARAEDDTALAADHPSGLLRVHSFASLGHRHIMPAIQAYRARYPDVHVELSLSQALANLFDGSCDTSIVAFSPPPDDDLASLQLGWSQRILCASPGYLAARGVPQSPDDLQLHDCLTLRTATASSQRWCLEGCDRVRVTLAVDSVVSINIAESLATAAREGMGIAPLPAYAALDELRDGTLVRVLPQYTIETREICILYPSRRFIDVRTRSWIDFICDWLPPRLDNDEAALSELARETEAPGVAALTEPSIRPEPLAAYP